MENIFMSSVVVAAFVALVGVLVGHWVKSRDSIRLARLDMQRLELEKQRADLEGLSKVVASLESLVNLQEKRINAMSETIGLTAADLDHERAYTQVLVRHIESALPPPPPPRPPRSIE